MQQLPQLLLILYLIVLLFEHLLDLNKNGKSIFKFTIIKCRFYFREQKKREDEAREKQTERRREAMNAQEVLRSLVEQIKDKEGSQGLIILEARYGQLTSTTTTINENSIKIIDVTVPLQALVKDSTLRIGTTVSKSNLTGFYDPCIGEEKSLFIKYSLRSQIHTILYKDTDPIILPNRGNEIYLFLFIKLTTFFKIIIDHLVQ
jgi:DnaJ family protein C protein 11